MFSRCSILRACTKLTRTDNPPLKSAELNSAKTKTLRNFFVQPFSRGSSDHWAALVPRSSRTPVRNASGLNAWAGMDLSRRRAAYSQFSVCVDDRCRGSADGSGSVARACGDEHAVRRAGPQANVHARDGCHEREGGCVPPPREHEGVHAVR
jgi:hypothetical protein